MFSEKEDTSDFMDALIPRFKLQTKHQKGKRWRDASIVRVKALKEKSLHPF
jgi:hypothetical protein